MDTKRCPRCNKLLRFDAQICSRCGMSFSLIKEKRKRIVDDTDYTSASSQPTNPPASPHQAGHYSGLHPEDQPFQSSFFLPVQRPVVHELVSDEPETLPQSELPTRLAVDPDFNSEPEPDFDLEPEPETLRVIPGTALDDEDFDASMREFSNLSALYPRQLMPPPVAPGDLSPRFNSPARKTRLLSILITSALICFLLASSLLTFLLLSRSSAHVAQPILLALPGSVRIGDILQVSGSSFHALSTVTMTRDAHIPLLDAQGKPLQAVTDRAGRFQAHMLITTHWSIGTHMLRATDVNTSEATATIIIQASQTGLPQLHLGTSRLDLGADKAGTISHKAITLTNAGGGQVSWRASSNVSWLTIDPTSGTFSGSAVVLLTVNRANLVPQAYLDDISFAQLSGSTQLLHISMTVNTTSAILVLSNASLTFTGAPSQSPASQTFIIQNSGGQSLDWTGGISTSSGGDWLSLMPGSGHLETGASAVLTVNINTFSMAPGLYQGTINLSYAEGPAQRIAITLTVNPPLQPVMQVTPQNISFSADQGLDPTHKSVIISNSGNAPLNWSVLADANGKSYLALSPTHGSVNAGQSMTLTVAPSPGAANGVINSTLTIVDSDQGSDLPPQQVKVSIAITSESIITPVSGTIEFDHDSVITDTSSLLIFSNTGSQVLNWSLTQSSSVPWLSFDITKGSVDSGSSAMINVRVISSGMAVGTYTLTLTISDSDAGTVVLPQQVKIILVISS